MAKPDEYIVTNAGKGLARQWTAEFVGASTAAARRAQKALDAKRTVAGT